MAEGCKLRCQVSSRYQVTLSPFRPATLGRKSRDYLRMVVHDRYVVISKVPSCGLHCNLPVEKEKGPPEGPYFFDFWAERNKSLPSTVKPENPCVPPKESRAGPVFVRTGSVTGQSLLQSMWRRGWFVIKLNVSFSSPYFTQQVSFFSTPPHPLAQARVLAS